ncbi:alpha/beta hydrolase [soil metagenome]
MGGEVNDMILDRRGLLAAGALLALATAVPSWARASVSPEVIDLTVSAKRSTKLCIWRPRKVRGVAIFSTGQGSWPERYAPLLIDLLTKNGFAVLSPVHVDSMHYPDREAFTAQQGFFERVADMRATSAQAAALFPGKPVIAVGHSYGSLIALGLGGALDFVHMRDESVKAVLCFSSPGKIPGLVRPGAFATLAVPTLLVTGTNDTVPTFVSDPADHLFPIESAPPGARYALVVGGADHVLVATPNSFAHARPLVTDFVEAYGLGDRPALARLAHFTPLAGDRYIDRGKPA